MVFISPSRFNSPLMQEPPGFAALSGRLRQDQKIAAFKNLFPQQLLLCRRKEKRELVAELGVKRVFPEPLDEGAEGQDVRRFPDGQPFRGLERVEFTGKNP